MSFGKFDDASIEKFDYTYVGRIEHLNTNLDYSKLIDFVENDIHLYGAKFKNIDYESAKFLLDYSEKYDRKLHTSSERKLLFLCRLPDDISERLFIECGYTQDLNLLVSNVDTALFKSVIKRYRDVIPFSDEEIREARKNYISNVMGDVGIYYDIMFDPVRVCSSDYYRNSDGSYISNAYESLEGRRIIANNVFNDLLFEYLFDDRYDNVRENIFSLSKYAREVGKDDDLESIEFLSEICSETSIGIYSIRNLFEKLEGHDVNKLLGSLNKKYFSETTKSLVDSCTLFTQDSKHYDEMRSRLNGCDTYYLDGDKFFAFVRSDVEVNKSEVCPEDVNVNRLGHSFTYIGQQDIQTYKNPNEVLTMIYSGVSEDNIGHVYHDDSWSTPDGSCTISEFYTADSLLEKSQVYPEIWMKDFSGIKPLAILCLDEATDWDYEVANRNGLSVVVVNSNKYERKHGNAKMGAQRY